MSRKGSRRLGGFLFFMPVVVVIAIVVVGIISLAAAQTGTLIITAKSSDRYSASIQLHPTITIGSDTATSPYNFTLRQGSYTVVYGSLNWFHTPAARSILVAGGKTEFAIGVYDPIIRHVSISANGFNVTSISALHDVTPVVWTNMGSGTIVLNVGGIKGASLNPSQNLTLVFPSSGTFNFDIVGSSYTGTVSSL